MKTDEMKINNTGDFKITFYFTQYVNTHSRKK